MTTHHHHMPSRRTVLAGGLGAIGAALLARASRADADAPASTARHTATMTSDNGWPELTSFTMADVQGSGLAIPLAPGAAATILTHVARRFHYEIGSLRPGDLVGGRAVGPVQVPEQSNYFSGTALGIRPGSYPVGQSGNLFAKQLVVIDDIVAECEGVVRWGGTLPVPMEGHFQIDLPPTDDRVQQLALQFGYVDALDSSRGAGAIDATDPARRARAKKFRRTHPR